MRLFPPFVFFLIIFFATHAFPADAPHWGIDQGRNRISEEKNLPITFQPGRKDPTSGDIVGTSANVRWAVKIGTNAYTPPVIADGRVLIGTNNEAKFDPTLDGDYGVMLCLDEKTGEFRWQYAVPKITDIPFADTPNIGITSTPLVRDGIVYFVDNRGLVCALNLSDGKPKWTLDLVKVFGIRLHDASNCSITIYEDILFVGTGNGQDARHLDVERPEAPSLVVLDVQTGKPFARDDDWLQTGIAHGQWCSPSFGDVQQADGTVAPTLFFALGNGVLHSVNAQKLRGQLPTPPEDAGQYGSALFKISADWTFNGNGTEALEEGNPFQKGRGSASYCCLPPPVFVDNRLYMLFCYDASTGARPLKAFLTALDPTMPPEAPTASRLLWKTPNIDGGALAPQAVSEGLVYIGDRNGGFYCLDAQSGETVWRMDLRGEHWGGPLVADGKIYIGTNRRMFYVLQAGREAKMLAEIEMPDAMHAGATAANGTLFIPGNGFLYAVEETR